MSERKRLYTVLQVGNTWLAKNKAGWSEECYRDLLARHGAEQIKGKYSATTMTLTQLEQAHREMKDMGFKPKRKKPADGKGSNWRKPRIAKLNAMWIAMHEAGVVENRSQEAMQKWCENQVPDLTKLQWAKTGQLNKAVEMMKAMAINAGVVVD